MLFYPDDAIFNTHPNVVTVSGDRAFDADDNPVVLDQSKIDAELVRLQAEYDGIQYHRDRAKAYPSLAEQADMQYWDSVNGTTTWADAIAAVKAAHPKP